jgi:hypothetical protein
MKGCDDMTVSTTHIALQVAITAWRNSFTGVTTHQAAGDVLSSLQDLCIDNQIGLIELPATLYDLYTEARRRAEGGRVGTFGAAELICAANDSLGEL